MPLEIATIRQRRIGISATALLIASTCFWGQSMQHPAAKRPTGSASKPAPDPNLDLVGSWGAVTPEEDIGLSIEFAKDPKGAVSCILNVKTAPTQSTAKTEDCAIQRKSSTLVLNGNGTASETDPTAVNHIVMGQFDSDVLKGLLYPGKKQFVLYLHGGPSETKRLQEIADQKANEERARQEAEKHRQEQIATRDEANRTHLQQLLGNWHFTCDSTYTRSDLDSRSEGMLVLDTITSPTTARGHYDATQGFIKNGKMKPFANQSGDATFTLAGNMVKVQFYCSQGSIFQHPDGKQDQLYMHWFNERTRIGLNGTTIMLTKQP